jgi:hypothetical protein
MPIEKIKRGSRRTDPNFCQKLAWETKDKVNEVIDVVNRLEEQVETLIKKVESLEKRPGEFA